MDKKEALQILGLDENASKQEIDDAYKKLSEELDPANNDNDEFFIEKHKELQDAYQILSEKSILKKDQSSPNITFGDSSDDPPEDSKKSSVTVTISSERIDELKREAQENRGKSKPHQTPSMFQNPFSFTGRIRRLEYGLSSIILYIWVIFSSFIAMAIDPYNFEGPYYMMMIPGYWFYWAQGAKRCHDRGNTGWFQLIPFYGLWMLFGDGEVGNNRYGSNPKGINQIL